MSSAFMPGFKPMVSAMAGMRERNEEENIDRQDDRTSSDERGCARLGQRAKEGENHAEIKLTGLLADDTGLEALADFTSREVKALSPAVLIKVSDERVKLVHEVGGAEDPVADTLAILLIEEIVVGVDAGVDEVLGHRAGLPGEDIERVLTEPGVFHGEIQTAGRGDASRRPLHGRVFQAD